jgi:hypothetical protein
MDIIITLVVALLIFIVVEFVLRFFKVQANLAHGIAVVVAVIWLLKGFHVL